MRDRQKVGVQSTKEGHINKLVDLTILKVGY